MVSSAIPCTYLSFYTWTVPIAVSPCSLWENRRKQTRLSSHRSLPIRSFTLLSLSLSLSLCLPDPFRNAPFDCRWIVAEFSGIFFLRIEAIADRAFSHLGKPPSCLPLNSILQQGFYLCEFLKNILDGPLRRIVFNSYGRTRIG